MKVKALVSFVAFGQIKASAGEVLYISKDYVYDLIKLAWVIPCHEIF